MESGRRKTRINVQGDRLSNLPDDLIHKILSFVGIKLAFQTSALSSRWRYLWTSLPRLDFSSEDFKTLPKFSNFVTHVLSCRNNQTETSSAKLSFRGKASQVFVKKILNYAFSHNIKQLTVSWEPDRNAVGFPLSLFSSKSLEHLTFAGHYCSHVILTSTWELTSLTTLHLEYITFNDEVTAKDIGIFSKCANLKTLVLRYCTMTRPNGVDICHPGLSDLTLEHDPYSDSENVINVAAPQLKNLTVRSWQGLHLISAPELVSLRFEGRKYQWLKFSSYELCSLESVDLCITSWSNKPEAHTIFDLLQQLHSVKYLTLNVEMFQVLSPLVELVSYQPSPFVNLKSLKVYPSDLCVKKTIPAEVKKYLLDGSPSATFTEVSREEMRALKNAASALNRMTELGVMLEREKANIKTNIDHLDRVMIPMECHKEQDKMQINNWQIQCQINSYWKDLSAQIERGKAKTSDIISKLGYIQGLLTELPASKRTHIVTSYSRLCTEADIVMDAIMDSMKIRSCEKLSRFSIYFHDLAMAAKPSF